MRKRLIMMAIAGLMTTASIAQQRSAGSYNQAERMKTVLELDEQQYASIRDINEKYSKRAEEMKANGQVSDRSQLQALRSDRRKEVEAVLTPAQKEKWEIYKRDRVEKRMAYHEKRKAAGKDARIRHAEKMKAELGLSDEQAEKMKAANAKFQTEMQALRSASQSSGTQDETALAKIRADHEAAVRSILTAEQFEKWMQRRPGRK